MEYATPERRTTRKDLKRKRCYNKYKKGGSNRTNYIDGRTQTQSE
jgi:hypothetical protein